MSKWLSPGMLVLACEAEGDRNASAGPPGVEISASATGSSAGTDPLDDDDASGGLQFDIGGAGDEGGGNNNCDEIVDEADVGPRPQDIIFVIDTSGSMIQEAGFVQEQMNSFSIQIEAANVDARIILLAEYPQFIGPGVCIDPPLGSGGCPNSDSNPPKFLHVPNSDVGSSDALFRLVELYSAYAPFLRPTAVTHVVIVSDDNSALPAADFTAQWSALAPHLGGYVMHGIIASEDPDAACAAGTACCTLAASQGSVYQELIAMTGGVEGNLCDQQFQPIFQTLGQEVVGGATLACSYVIPDPPDGATFDQDEVNVDFDDGQGGTLQIGRVDDISQCADVMHGWYYDNPVDPGVILVCPQTCDTIQGWDQASVAIKFGCETVPAG